MGRANWEPQTLGIPVDNWCECCGKVAAGADGFPPRTPPFQERLSFMAQLIDSAVGGLELLTARVEALGAQQIALLAIIDQPLSPTEAIERLRAIRSELRPAAG